MSPEGCKLLPEGHRAAGSRPEGSNLQPEGDIIWPVGGNFPVSQGRRCRISNIIWKGPGGNLGATRAAALVAIENRAAALVAYSNRAATWKSHCLAPRGKLFQVKALPYDIDQF